MRSSYCNYGWGVAKYGGGVAKYGWGIAKYGCGVAKYELGVAKLSSPPAYSKVRISGCHLMGLFAEQG
jgi:hypothetical protein